MSELEAKFDELASGEFRPADSLKEIILGLLARHPEGLDMKGIRAHLLGIHPAKSLSASVSQAVNALRQEGRVSLSQSGKTTSTLIVSTSVQ